MGGRGAADKEHTGRMKRSLDFWTPSVWSWVGALAPNFESVLKDETRFTVRKTCANKPINDTMKTLFLMKFVNINVIIYSLLSCLQLLQFDRADDAKMLCNNR